MQLLIAEYYLKAGNDALAKSAYNNAIVLSIEQYFSFRSLSNDNTSGAVTPPDDAEIASYQSETAVNWDNAATAAEKLEHISHSEMDTLQRSSVD